MVLSGKTAGSRSQIKPLRAMHVEPFLGSKGRKRLYLITATCHHRLNVKRVCHRTCLGDRSPEIRNLS